MGLSTIWPNAFASEWVLLLSVGLALVATLDGFFRSRSQTKWWLETREQYDGLRTAPTNNTTDKGTMLEHHVERLYRRMGYRIGTHNKEGEEHRNKSEKGIDVIVECKPFALMAAWPFRRFSLPKPALGRLGIQCKNYDGKAGVEAIQQAFAGSPYWDCRLRYATAISPGDFTPEAEKFGHKLRVKRIGGTAYEQAIDEFRPLGPMWPIGWPRILQLALLGVALITALLSYGAMFPSGELSASNALALNTATLIFVLLCIRAAFVPSPRRLIAGTPAASVATISPLEFRPASTDASSHVA